MPLNVNAASFNPGAAEFIPSSFMPIAVTGSENGKLSQGESSTRDQANVTPEPTRTHAGNGVNGTAQGNGVHGASGEQTELQNGPSVSVSGQDHSTVVIGSAGGYGRVKDQGSGGRASKGLFKDALVRSASKQSLAEDASRHDDEGKGANNHSLSQDDHDYDDDAKGLPAQLLRWNSFLCDSGGGEWQNLPSVVTWLCPSTTKTTRRTLLLEIPDHERRREPSLDDFEVLRLVGQGGFGKVYQVRKKASGKIFALKAMRKHLVIKELNVEGTQNERFILESVQHPFIVRLWSAFHDHGRLYLLMDWHNGGQLLLLIEEHAPFGENSTRFYLAEIVLAIEGLHERGIVHRDLKPENVLLTSRGHIIVTDFGASKLRRDDDDDIHTNSWVGTELYMAPEQLQGKVYGRVVDWWAVGVLAWEMCTGDNPFYHTNPEQVAIKVQKKKLAMPAHLGPATHSLFKGLLNRDPEKRLGKNGSAEVKTHPFFKVKGFNWKKAYAMEETPPFFDPTLLEDQLNHSRSSNKYTTVTPVMSPVLESVLSPKSQSLFNGFEYVSPLYSPAPNRSPRDWHTNALGMPELFLQDPHDNVQVPETVGEDQELILPPPAQPASGGSRTVGQPLSCRSPSQNTAKQLFH